LAKINEQLVADPSTIPFSTPLRPGAISFLVSRFSTGDRREARKLAKAMDIGEIALLDYFFAPMIASFATLKTRNLVTVLAGILIFCFVDGLIPVRAFLF